MKRIFFCILAAFFFLIMLMNPSLTVAGAKEGLLLWFHTIIPALLPFMIFSNLLVSMDAMHYITFLFEPIVKILFKISPQGSYALLTGLLCGYPMGAKSCVDLVSQHKITHTEGEYLLCFSNNASPAFVLSYLCGSVLGNSNKTMAFMIAIYSAPLLASFFIYPFFRKEIRKSDKMPVIYSKKTKPIDFSIVDNSIMNGFETVTKLGGYIILFSILSNFISKISVFSVRIKYFLLGITEMTTGIAYLNAGIPNAVWKGMALCACISFGGLSGIFQTKCILKSSGLSIFPYILSKIGISILSAILFAFLFTIY